LVGLLSKLPTDHLIVCRETLRKIVDEQTLVTLDRNLLENVLHLLGRITLRRILGNIFWWMGGGWGWLRIMCNDKLEFSLPQ
jgi:hypothetical protein